MELIKLHQSDNDLFFGYAQSRIGGRLENQDSFSFNRTSLGFLVTVCDGMGGGPSGKQASALAVSEIIGFVKQHEEDDTSIVDIVRGAVEQANKVIFDTTEEHPEQKGMGTTATVLLLTEQSAVIAHVGDSRVYQFRGHEKVFRTFDHSVVFDLVKQGIITEEQARLSAQSNVITRALGVRADVEIDVCEVPYEKGDRFMLCTDGIHSCMSEQELIKLATIRNKSLGPVADNIATTADDIGRVAGGEHDNLTVALVQLKKNSNMNVPMSNKTKHILFLLSGLLFLSVLLNIIQCITRKPAYTYENKPDSTLQAEDRKRQEMNLEKNVNSVNNETKKQ